MHHHKRYTIRIKIQEIESGGSYIVSKSHELTTRVRKTHVSPGARMTH